MSKNSWPVFIPRPISVVRGILNVWVYDSFVMPILQVVRLISGDISQSRWEGFMMIGCFLLFPVFAFFHWGLGKILNSLYSGWSKDYPMSFKAHCKEGLLAFNVAFFVRQIIIILHIFVAYYLLQDTNNIMLGAEPPPDEKWELIGEVLAVIPYWLAVFFYHINDLFKRYQAKQKPLLFQKPEKLPFYQRNKSTIKRKRDRQ